MASKRKYRIPAAEGRPAAGSSGRYGPAPAPKVLHDQRVCFECSGSPAQHTDQDRFKLLQLYAQKLGWGRLSDAELWSDTTVRKFMSVNIK